MRAGAETWVRSGAAQSGECVNTDNPGPPQLQDFTWYYVRQASADGLSFKLATTNSDSTIVTSYTPTNNIAFYSNVQDRTTNIPTLIYRHNGAVGMANGGYLTLAREACGYLYLAGLMPITGFQAADAFFQQENATGAGPAGFSSAIFMSFAAPAGFVMPSSQASSPAMITESSQATSATPSVTTSSSSSTSPAALVATTSKPAAKVTPDVVDSAIASLASRSTSSTRTSQGSVSAEKRLGWLV